MIQMKQISPEKQRLNEKRKELRKKVISGELGLTSVVKKKRNPFRELKTDWSAKENHSPRGKYV